ncbi:hypothetical protein [Blastopirellula marina]|uniref:Uncharacterized protein n=1 Tax=Blastopirellula marina TaxID=124 RepID=A0A2S8GGE1_9BACT|nr:hypothetical protein [Blastopirellula marina]PQO43493.1 hypothetical protein C5Y93_22830 [Blastopirellula marina]
MPHAWNHDWHAFAQTQVREFGFASLTEFVRCYEACPYDQLAMMLGGKRLAAVQIQQLLRGEAQSDADREYYVRSTLVRALNKHVPAGIRSHEEWSLVLALTSWTEALDEADRPRSLELAKRLKADADLPADWLPSSIEDPVILRLFG